ncbi:MAG TPA: ATP-binding protein [Solirubrobacterales bacterium]|nr:ATP-binding protein [Solirubrobacterales bacterium]
MTSSGTGEEGLAPAVPLDDPDGKSFDEQIEQRSSELLEERLEQVDEVALRWLALLPEWTVPLAYACEFPAGDSLPALLDNVQQLGFCEVVTELDIAGEETVRFWMYSDIRSALLKRWRAEAGLSRDIDELAASVLQASEEEPAQVPLGARRWAELARDELSRGPVTGEALTGEVVRSLADKDPGRAGEWIFAGEALSKPLGAEMDSAATRARRQVDFYYRRVQDARYLRHFIEREEQIEELRKLVSADEVWALHFIGPSGVGKTMLMRYLTGRHFGSSLIAGASRIDFDYIDPRYPLESPARLLYELGEGLAVELENATQESLFRSFREAVTEAEAVRLDPVHPLQALRTPEFEKVIAAFAAFVNGLQQPVALILDTCEELAKLHPPGEDVPSISATFEILERVHAAAPTVKVVFAGRRWLTPEAANISRKDPDATPKSVMCMKPRPYMLMHEVRGFTEAEVVAYLSRVCRNPPSSEMLQAVLEITTDRGRAASIADPSEPPAELRYNPNDVSLLGGWLAEDPELSPQSLAGGNLDPFVEARIFGRLESPEVLAAIPAAILLERFDAVLIDPALGRDRATRESALNGLIDQEWTHLEGGPGPRDIVIEIDRGLLERLNNYYERTPERRRQIDDARSALTPHLADLLERAPADASVDAIDAALRLLPPNESARRFDRLADRVAQAGAWSWAEATCGRLLSPEREPPLDEALVPSVGALYVAALEHRGSSINLGPLWTTVAEQSVQHPDREQAAVLAVRGRLGVLAAAAANGGFDLVSATATLRAGEEALEQAGPVSPVASALISAIEALVDAAEERAYPLPVEAAATCLARLFENFGRDELTQAQVLTLEGRVRVLSEDWQAARTVFDRVERMPLKDRGEEPRFVDWVPPGSIRHRVLLELLRFRLAEQNAEPSLLKRCESAAFERVAGADAAQLLSLVVQAQLAGTTPDLERLYLLRRYDGLVETYDLTAPAHRVAPPLFVSLAEAWLARGEAGSALGLLAERERLATSRRTDEDVARAAALATVRILRRLRLRDRLALIGSFSSAEDEELRGEALAAGALIAGLQPPPGRTSDRDHAAWQARILLNASGDEVALNRGLGLRQLLPRRSDSSLASIHAALDRIEAGMVRQRTGVQSAGLRLDRKFVEKNLPGSQPTLADPLAGEEVRLQLRLIALIGGAGKPVSSIRVVDRPRLVGQLALEEGELLALRLPDRAIWLLATAEERLAYAEDFHGAFVAALRRAIAEIHAERADDARGRRASILGHYEKVREIDPELPPPQRLHFVDEDTGGKGEGFWRAWVIRLAAYLAWCDGVPLDSRMAGATLGLDPELTLTPAGREPAAAVAAQDRAAAPPVDLLDVSIAIHHGGEEPEFEAVMEPWPPTGLARGIRLISSLIGGGTPGKSFPLNEMQARPVVPSALARDLRARAESPRAIRLAVTSDLAPLNWEWRLVGDLLWNEGWVSGKIPAIWRIRPPGHFTPPPDRWSQTIAVVSSSDWLPLVASSADDAADLKVSAERSRQRGEGAQRAAAIAIGSPVITRAGWRLRLDDDELSGQLSDPSEPHSQDLMSPDRLAREAPVVIVFGRPGGLPRTADRPNAEGLRGFANETFVAGAHAVIAVPTLPPGRASEAIAFITAAIARCDAPPGTDLLLEWVRGLRVIACGEEEKEGGTDPALPKDRLRDTELALDVCLFAPR